MLSEKDKYALIKSVINEFSNFNYNVHYFREELDKILKSEDFKSKKLAFKSIRAFHGILSFTMASFVIFMCTNVPYLIKSSFKLYKTTAYTYVNGELTSEPIVDYIRDLERDKIVYLDIVPVSELSRENANIYRYDVTNKGVFDISDYNNLYFDETSEEFVAKASFNKIVKDKSVPYKEVTIILQNKDKYIIDEESYNNYKTVYLKSIISSTFPLLSYYLVFSIYKDIKKKYEEKINSIYKEFVEPHISYKDNYKYKYEELRKDVEEKSELEMFDTYFSSLYKEASEIEETFKKLNKTLRK